MTRVAPPQPKVDVYTDDQGREFFYVLKRHQGARDLVIHFSAFFGDWGDAKAYRSTFQGYFHRLRMLGDDLTHNWLFLCDQYGADENGTYYTGKGGDFYVERAMSAIIAQTLSMCGIQPCDVVTIGSSMGATGAVKFGLLLGVRGIIAVSPHIDLDICAARQGRERHVAFLVPDGDTQSPKNYPYTRQITGTLKVWDRDTVPPRMFVQVCEDDDGVFAEQVQPLVRRWQDLGGDVTLDSRRTGGHTSDYATRALLLDAVDKMYSGGYIDVGTYQTNKRFRPVVHRSPPLRRLYIQVRTLGAKGKALIVR